MKFGKSTTVVRRSLTLLLMIVIAPVVFYGKRVPPKPVKPVFANGVKYSAEGDGKTAYIVATGTATSEEKWRVRIFNVHIKFWMEEDVQWVYITDLKISRDCSFEMRSNAVTAST